MLSNSRSQVAGEAEVEEQIGETHVNFQVPGECSLGPEQTLYCPSVYEEFLRPSVPDDTYQGTLLPASAFKNENDHFGWDTGFGMDT